MNATYFKYEFLRLWRNKRFFFFSLVFPLILFSCLRPVEQERQRRVRLGDAEVHPVLHGRYGRLRRDDGVDLGGARIAAERQVGWNRQLRLTPLRVPTYFAAKILTSYVMALLSIAVLFIAGLIFGVHVPVGRWAEMIGLILIGLLPFIAIGIIIGHLLTVDSLGPALGGGAALFALLGGMWFPFTNGSTLQKIGEYVRPTGSRKRPGSGSAPTPGPRRAGWSSRPGPLSPRSGPLGPTSATPSASDLG